MTSERIPLADLVAFCATAFRACDVPAAAADEAAQALCYADEVGLDTHGAINLERIYVPRLVAGIIDPRATPTILAQAPAVARFDGRGGLGLVVGTRAIDEAIARARACGVALVVVANSSHLGSVGYYASRATAHGMIGIAMTNLGGQAIAPPPGGLEPMLGTNPIAAAAPAGERADFVLDMSTTVVSTGRVRAAARAGEQAPEGWLVDAAGAAVTDPAAYDRGEAQLQWLGGGAQTGGYKGFGLGILVEILCAVLSGAQDAPTAGAAEVSDYDVGHFFLAIDIAALRPAATFEAAMATMLDTLVACPARPGTSVQYPGLPEDATRRERRRLGVPLEHEVRASLDRVATSLGIPPLRPLVER
ncbi:MAG TPA: Ldh family oxidoreductase [Solirubrobacteraceae bacterium]|jgi:LDH2 family malate/lactate/ureidoglycolate dehydrogenase|nr:Ldh family oxidoreductase [Solirubrobacteraceae bacterium]